MDPSSKVENDNSQSEEKIENQNSGQSLDHHHDHHHHDHHHDHHHHHSHDDQGSKNIWIVFMLNFVFAIVEAIGGWLTNSAAIQADALHDFGDSLSILLNWILNKLSLRPITKNYSYGLARLRMFGALITGAILIFGSLLMMIHNVPRILKPEEIHTPGMIGLAILGIIINGLAFLKLKFQKNYNEKILSLHMLEDVLGWGIVLIGALFIHVFHVYWLDPLLSVCLSVYIIWHAIGHVRGIFQILLQGVTNVHLTDQVLGNIKNVNKVLEVHHLHVWSLHEDFYVITAHIVLDEDLRISEVQEIKKSIHEVVSKLLPCESIFEFELQSTNCLDQVHQS